MNLYVGRNHVEIYCVCIIICKRLLTLGLRWNPHLFCFVEECRWPCAKGRSGLIITGHRSISVFKVDTAVLVNLRSNSIYFFSCPFTNMLTHIVRKPRTHSLRIRLYLSIILKTHLEKYFPIEVHETTALGRNQQTHYFVWNFRVNLQWEQKNITQIKMCSLFVHIDKIFYSMYKNATRFWWRMTNINYLARVWTIVAVTRLQF